MRQPARSMVRSLGVMPGDIVVGDENGVIVMHPEEAEAAMEFAIRKREREDRITSQG